MTTVMDPAAVASMSLPRMETSLTASFSSKTPAMQAATHSPKLCPSSAAGLIPYAFAHLKSAY